MSAYETVPTTDATDAADAADAKVDYSKMESIPGYSVGSGDPSAAVAAPPAQSMPPAEIIEFNISSDVKAKTKDQSRERLLKYIDDTCCWGSGPAKECEIDTCVGLSSFHCKVQTYVETRNTYRTFVPYHPGTHYTSPRDGRAPLPWEMQCVVHTYFTEQSERIEVPYTSTIQSCHRCHGCGKITCSSCRGSGQVRCGHCGGDGKVTVTHHHTTGSGKNKKSHTTRTQERCNTCGGDGKVRDSRCGGTGKVTCDMCTGTGQLRHFIMLHRVHTTLVNEKVVDSIPDEDLPPKLISAAKGKTIIEKDALNIAPPKGFNDEVDQALKEIDDNAAIQVKQLNALQHQERIALKAVPVTAVKAHAGEDKFRWYIYGLDDLVEVKDYPATMCCGCDIA